MSSFIYTLKQGFKNLFRNRLFSLASVGTITACLFLFGLFFCILINFQYIFSKVETTVGVTVFFTEGTSEERILEIKADIENLENTDKVTYTSPEQAWEDYKEKAFPEGDNEVLTNLDSDNPLADSASLEVYLKDPELQDEVITYIESIPDVRSVNSSESVAKSLSNIGRLIGYVSIGLIAILIGVSVFLISNTVMIGVTVRKEEIAIMKYLGATDFFVRGPYLIEGLIIGFIGFLIPIVILKVLYERVVDFISTHFRALNSLLKFMDVNEVFRLLVPVSLLIGLGIGFFGSYFTLRRHVRV